MTAFRKTALALLVFVVGLASALGQTSNGTIVGAVTDASGAAIVGATVTVVSAETGAVRTGLTTQDGTYRIESLLAGTYKVTGSATGFRDGVLNGLIVPSSAIVSASLQLEVGAASNKVEVTADNSAINIDNGQISGTIGTLEISSLPISTLNPYQLALTLPGVMSITQGAGGFINGVNFNVGGGRPRANNFLIEGQDNNDAGIQGQGLQPGNDEAVKEVTIIENAYTAEYGHGAGSVSNLVYKSGTNQFHGSVFERLNNSSLDTWDIADKRNGATQETKYRENLPGFSIGGPIKKNKAFFFASYQWDYYRSSANLANLAIPTADGLALLKSFDNPNVNKNGVPYLSKSVSTRPTDGQNDSGSETETQVATYPSSTVQAICAPAIDMLKNIKSFVVNLFFCAGFMSVLMFVALGFTLSGGR